MTDNLPINWQDKMAKEAKTISRAFRPSTAQISTKSGFMSYMGQAIPGNKLEAIILGVTFENNYFEGKFDPNNPRNPSCFAFGKADDEGRQPEMIPHQDVLAPFAAICSACPYSQWRSDTESVSGKGKRCKELYKVGLIPKGQSENSDEMAVLRVPGTSRKNLEVYIQTLAAQGRSLWSVVTEVSTHPHMKNQFEIKFRLVELLPDERLGEVYPKIEGCYEALMEPYQANADPLALRPPVEEKPSKQKKY